MIQCTTPQGLFATFSDNYTNWETLTLAKNQQGEQLEFSNVQGPLKAALQTHQQFLVITNPRALARHFTSTKITIAGWTFNLDPSEWNTHSTILIFKFYAGKSLKTLAQDAHLWTTPATFTGDVTATQTAIATIIETAAGSGDPLYANFVAKVTDENWNGILALNAYVPLTALPAQIEGLAAGIDPALFDAHHVGINITPIHQAGCGDLYMGASSIFALIDYPPQGSTPSLPPSSPDYGFAVESLQVLIENSLIQVFHSTVKLTINQLFDEKVTLQPGGPPNSFTLRGTYVSHGGHPSYTFTTTSPSVFTCNSVALDTIEINSAQFVTLVKSSQPLGGEVHTRFILEGSIRFQTLTDFDLFSFDTLPFSNLFIDMGFTPSKPDLSNNYSFDASDISFDAAHVSERSGSLASQFPLKINGLQYGTRDKPPKGFLPVGMPNNFSDISNRWYGLSFTLSLGSMGALAPHKSFDAILLTSWSPTPAGGTPVTTHYPVSVAIKLPFVSADLFHLEGIIKLGLKVVEFDKSDSAYILKFREIALKILSLKIPPTGVTDIMLFGDPNGTAKDLAWYAAYAK